MIDGRPNVISNVISIVDDDFSVRRALGRLVRAAGYTVETFSSALEFLDSTRQDRSACVVLDIQMDGMNGFELQERLAADRPALPVIFMTAYDDAATRGRVKRSGVAAFLLKPFDDWVLLDAIRTAVA